MGSGAEDNDLTEDSHRHFSEKYLAKNKMSSRKGSSGKCHRLGRLTRNPFLNFLREFRKTHCNMGVVQIACEGAKEWRTMSDEQKQQYSRGLSAVARKGKKRKSSKGSVPKLVKSSVSPRDSKSPRRSMSKSA